MHVLVVGGAGYIGSHMVLMLAEQGHEVTVFDNFSTGYRDAILTGRIVEGDLADTVALERLFSSNRFDAVMHFASFIQVGESVREPLKYYRNNASNTLNLLEAMVRHKVLQFVFSSTAAVFGEPQHVPIDETHPQSPVNPYGASKLMVERMLADFETAYGLRAVSLRYFNAAGADPQGRLGERHEPETHLIPLVLEAAIGKRPHITVFGRDYDTPDGTCIRDYIHIVDLCSAHLAALDYLAAGKAGAFNLGNGAGYSVDEVIRVSREVTGKEIPVQYGERRAGDPARLVADATRARAELKWQPRYADLPTIIAHAWQWASKRH